METESPDKLYTLKARILARTPKTAKKSIDSIQSIKHLRKGLAIYKTGRSPFWFIRLREPLAGRYITRSSKETSRLDAEDQDGRYAKTFVHGQRVCLFLKSGI